MTAVQPLPPANTLANVSLTICAAYLDVSSDCYLQITPTMAQTRNTGKSFSKKKSKGVGKKNRVVPVIEESQPSEAVIDENQQTHVSQPNLSSPPPTSGATPRNDDLVEELPLAQKEDQRTAGNDDKSIDGNDLSEFCIL